MMHKQTIKAGLYLVIDPATRQDILFKKLNAVLQENIVAVQVWDNFSPEQNVTAVLAPIVEKCNAAGVPVLINNRWEMLQQLPLDGVHFDAVPADIESIRTMVNRPFITGITCNNDLSVVQWAAEQQLDYISFCSMFPSATSNSCERVQFKTVQQARRMSAIPIFLAGGIGHHNLPQLSELPYDGIAVVSGIMSAEDPKDAAKAYLNELKK